MTRSARYPGCSRVRLPILLGAIWAGFWIAGATRAGTVSKILMNASANGCPGYAATYSLGGSDTFGWVGCIGTTIEIANFELDEGVSVGGSISISQSTMDSAQASVDPGCYEAWMDGQNVSAVFSHPFPNYNGATWGFSLAVQSPDLFDWGGDVTKAAGSGRYVMSSGPSAVARPSGQSAGVSPSAYSWSLPAAPPGCAIDGNGVISGCTGPGTVRVKGTFGTICYEASIDVDDCDGGCSSGGCLNSSFVSPSFGPVGSGITSLGESGAAGEIHGGGPSGIDVRFHLGWSAVRSSAGFIQIQRESPAAATPAILSYNFARSDVKRLTNAAGLLQQLRTPTLLVNVVTNTAFDFRVDYYDATNVLWYTNIGNNVYQYTLKTNAPTFQSVTLTNLNSDINKLRISQWRENVETRWDFSWITNGWELTSGSGLRKEVHSTAWSETNTLRTVTYQVRDGTDALVFQRVQRFRTNATYGERIIESVTGTGSNALTNTYVWTGAGYLQKAVRADGSWEFFVYDALNRPTNIYSSFANQAFTTNKALCRFIEHDYSSNAIPGALDGGFFDSTTPRRTIEWVLDKEVGRRYYVALPAERRAYQAVAPGASWNDSSNLVTITKMFTNGFNRYEVQSVLRPDKTIEISQPGPVVLYSTNLFRTNIVLQGQPDSAGTNILQGIKTVTVIGSRGETRSRIVSDVPSGLVLSSEAYGYDGYNRLTNTTYLDGRSSTTSYDCCAISSSTDREGMVTSYTVDALKRVITSTSLGIARSNVYDAANRILATVRIGTNNTAMTLSSATFDDAGRQKSETNAVNQSTLFTNYFNGSGQAVRQISYPNLSTRIETRNRDGSLASVTGTGVRGVRYDYGVEQDGTVWRVRTQEIKLDAAGSDTLEWTKTFVDPAGRAYKVAYPDNATATTYFNTNGQIVKRVDPDNVTTLLAYNGVGELEFTVIDMDGNGATNLAGLDRVTRTVREVVNNGVSDVERLITYAWATNNDGTASVVGVTERSTDGLRSWNATFGNTNLSRVVYSGTHRYVTNTAPDGSVSVSDFQEGRLLSTTRRDSTWAQLGQTTYGYDAHGRQTLVTDARTGTITNGFDNADRVISTATPAPATGQASLVTTMVYNNMGQVATNTAPDGGVVVSQFLPTGELATNFGARTYPVTYTYDYAGRLKTMTTWTNYATGSGAAVTTWHYDALRGWLTNKAYADGLGPKYSYTSAGRLSTRTWMRGVSTTYGYGAAGDLVTVNYSDSTPDVTNGYDRRGRAITIDEGGSVTTTRGYKDSG